MLLFDVSALFTTSQHTRLEKRMAIILNTMGVYICRYAKVLLPFPFLSISLTLSETRVGLRREVGIP